MKKLVAVLCAAVMTVGMAVNVFAAPSPSVSGVVTAKKSLKQLQKKHWVTNLKREWNW